VYSEIAGVYGLKPAQLALAFNISRPFMTSTIIGATKLEQLKENIDAVDVKLPEEIFEDIETAHNKSLFPCP
jgi:aryl-alcohol dehydrogenase-like predicted oxidoreductase